MNTKNLVRNRIAMFENLPKACNQITGEVPAVSTSVKQMVALFESFEMVKVTNGPIEDSSVPEENHSSAIRPAEVEQNIDSFNNRISLFNATATDSVVRPSMSKGTDNQFIDIQPNLDLKSSRRMVPTTEVDMGAKYSGKIDGIQTNNAVSRHEDQPVSGASERNAPSQTPVTALTITPDMENRNNLTQEVRKKSLVSRLISRGILIVKNIFNTSTERDSISHAEKINPSEDNVASWQDEGRDKAVDADERHAPQASHDVTNDDHAQDGSTKKGFASSLSCIRAFNVKKKATPDNRETRRHVLNIPLEIDPRSRGPIDVPIPIEAPEKRDTKTFTADIRLLLSLV